MKFVALKFSKSEKLFCLGRMSYGSGLNHGAEFPVLSHVILADATRTVALVTAEMAKHTSLDALKCRVGL